MTPCFSEQFNGVKYNHFYEWEEDNDELFEIIPLPPTPDPSDSEATPSPLPPTRAAKFRNVIKFVTGKKSGKKTGEKSEERQSGWSGNKHATLPRMNREERDARIRYLRDEVFGLGRFYQEPDPTKLYEKEDPTPFVPSRTKTVRWKSDPVGSRNIGTVGLNVSEGSRDVEAEVDNDLATSENAKWRNDNPYWEEEFELPEPELVYRPNSPPQHDPQAERISIDLSDILPLEFGDEPRPTSPPDLTKNATDTDVDSITDGFLNNSKLGCNCGDPSCNAACVHVLTVKGIQASLGQEIADLVVTEMILRLGPPLPLPPREVTESQTEVLALRKTAVIQMYVKWAATFTFQKLVVAIKLSLDHFKPSHRGIINFEFQDYQVFRNIDVKTKYLVIRKMRVVFDEHVRVLQNKCPKDAIFRQKIIGAPFWAEGQEYRFTPVGNYSGVLLNYKIKRGGIGAGQKATGATTRESL